MKIPSQPRVRVARLSLLAFFAIVTMLQLFSFPGQFAHMREMQGFSLLQEIVLTGLAGVFLLTVQIVIVSLWKVLSLMESGLFFTSASLVWINRIVTALKTSIAPPVVLFFIIAPQADDPGFLVLLTAVTFFLLTVSITASLLRDQIKTKCSD